MKIYQRKNRCFVRVQGSDAKKFLQNLLSQDLNQISQHSMRLSCVLNQKGGVEGFFWVHQADQESYVLDMLASMQNKVMHILKQYKLRSKVELLTESMINSYYTFQAINQPVFEQHVFKFEDGTELYRQLAHNIDQNNASGAMIPITADEWESFRLQQRWPRWEQDIHPGTLALQSDFLRQGIHFNKGCYLGQETIARLYARGSKVARKLVLLKGDLHHFKVGDSVMGEGESKGELSSVLHDRQTNQDLALATLHRSALLDGVNLKTDQQHHVEWIK